MAFHAIKTGEGDTYIAAGVEAVSRAGAGRPVRVPPRARRLRGLALQRLHLDGHDRRERRGASGKVSREAQDEWALISQTRAVAGAGVRPLRQGDRPRDRARAQRRDKEGNEIDVPETVVTKDDGPRPARRSRSSPALQARVQGGRHGHRGQRLPAERRRGGAADHERREGRREPASHRVRGSSPRRSPRSARRSWASARSPRSRSC